MHALICIYYPYFEQHRYFEIPIAIMINKRQDKLNISNPNPREATLENLFFVELVSKFLGILDIFTILETYCFVF